MTLKIGVNTWGTPSSSMGLNSGMDLAGMINKLMQAEDSKTRIPTQRKLQLNEWKQDAYRSMNTALAAFQGQIFNLQFNSGWQAQTATSTDPTKVTATAAAGAPSASHSVAVTTMATGASSSSTSGITQHLYSSDFGTTNIAINNSNNTVSLSLNGGATQTITIANGTYANMNALVSAVQAQINANVALNGNVTIGTSPSGAGLSLTPSGTNDISIVSTGMNFTAGQDYAKSAQNLIGSSITTPLTLSSSTNAFSLTLKGVQKTITLAAGTYSSLTGAGGLQQTMQSAIDQAFGANQITVGTSGSSLSLTPVGAPNALPQLQINNTSASTGATALGFTNGQAFKIDPNAFLGTQLTKLGLSSLAAGSFQINGQTISFDPNADTLNSLMSKVNSSAANVTMSYDSVNDKVIIATKNTGASAQISLTPTNDGGLLAALKLNTGTTLTGTNAVVSIDGVALSQSSNSFTYGGVNYNLIGTGNATVNVSADTAALTKQVTDFVNNYNTMINKIATKLYEPTYRGYPPLTDSQTNMMTDNQITQYNTQAQSGLLKTDDILQQLYSSFRSATYSSNAGNSTYHALYDIGITTQAYNANDPTNAGKLIVDTNKLQAAIAANPSDVAGIIRNVTLQLTTASQNAVNSITSRAGNTGDVYDGQSPILGYQAKSMEDQITSEEKLLNSKFNLYVKQFTAMDNAIGKSNQQMTFLQNLKF